ncbi:PadR family transcriptional regulator [Lysinibacillus sp. FSL K6-0232]|uniref:PadR family transcriptional regulator n=1 Tax=unclassified Lysinibacillus TaxID=2636778 RepID=UPI0030FA711A
MHYILLALREPLHGYALMQKIEELSDGNVRIAAGTMYGAIENLLKYQWITPVATEDTRRKVYQITAEGLAILAAEQQRLQHILAVYERVDGHEEI